MKYVAVESLAEKHSKLRKDDVAKIQDWLLSQPHLPKISDTEVALFLHASYFSVEAAKVRLDNYYTCRTKMDFVFSSRDVAGDDIKEHHDVVIHVPLPTPTPEGYRVNLIKVMKPEKFDLRTFNKKCNFVCEIDLLERGPDEAGIFVVDMEGSKLSHLAQANPSEVKQLIFYSQHAFNGRLTHIHFINPPPFMAQVLAFLKPFLTPERRNQIWVHETFEDIYKYVPAEIFPDEYKGGKAGPLAELNDNYYKYLLEHRDYFLEEEKTRRVNEELRPAKASGLDAIFGVDGTFKKLIID